MAHPDPGEEPHVATIEVNDKRYDVTCRITYDGIEYVGRLWFADESWDDAGLPDRGAIPGRTRDEVLESARRLTPENLRLRYRRAASEKRRYFGLRRATEEILSKIRYLNQVAVSMRAGLLDIEGAAQEITMTERQLHELIDALRANAGVEGES
jgi:hypothetical protein